MSGQRFFLIFLILFSVTSIAAEKAKWELLSKDDGIVVYRNNEYSEGIIPAKAIMELPHSLEEIVAVILDTKKKSEWAARVPAVKIIKKTGPYSVIEYAQLDFPWPFSDRYFIVHSTMAVSTEKNKVIFDLHSVEDAYKPEDDDYVRGHIFNGGIELEQIGDKVKATVHLYSDPKGSIPKWVVNMFSEKTSVNFMKTLRKQIGKKIYDTKHLKYISREINKASKYGLESLDRLPATQIGTNP
jgi:hypothetical protein